MRRPIRSRYSWTPSQAILSSRSMLGWPISARQRSSRRKPPLRDLRRALPSPSGTNRLRQISDRSIHPGGTISQRGRTHREAAHCESMTATANTCFGAKLAHPMDSSPAADDHGINRDVQIGHQMRQLRSIIGEECVAPLDEHRLN